MEDKVKSVQEMQAMTSTQPLGSSRGAWVTVHLLPAVGQERGMLGYLIGSEAGMLKLTKLATQAEHVDDGIYAKQDPSSGHVSHHQGAHGVLTKIHDGVWLINPMHVWMVEHEQNAPLPGFKPLEF